MLLHAGLSSRSSLTAGWGHKLTCHRHAAQLTSLPAGVLVAATYGILPSAIMKPCHYMFIRNKDHFYHSYQLQASRLYKEARPQLPRKMKISILRDQMIGQNHVLTTGVGPLEEGTSLCQWMEGDTLSSGSVVVAGRRHGGMTAVTTAARRKGIRQRLITCENKEFGKPNRKT